jgi:elongation factor P
LITTSDFSNGTRIILKDEPYSIVSISRQSPSARGASTLVKIKARNLLTGKLVSETIKSGTKFVEPDIQNINVQFLFTQGENAVFMNQDTFDQFEISVESIGGPAKYMTEELKIKAMYYNDNPINVTLPDHVELVIDTVEPGQRGNTASGSVTTRATLSNGCDVQVPLNIKQGDKVLINTNDDTFHQRA